jgi:hypothetical protein
MRPGAHAALVLAVTSTVLFAGGCGHSTTSNAMKDYEFVFHLSHPAGRPTDIVRAYVAVDRAGHIRAFYAVMRLASGAVVSERMWSSSDPNTELGRDWTTCQQARQALPEAIPGTVAALEASVLGPAVAPRGATVIAPSTWQIGQGIAVMTVHQLGPGITERVVTIGLPGKEAGTTITDAALLKVAALPDLIATWSTCRPSRAA